MGKCDNCGNFTELQECKITEESGVRYRKLCDKCISQLQSSGQLQILGKSTDSTLSPRVVKSLEKQKNNPESEKPSYSGSNNYSRQSTNAKPNKATYSSSNFYLWSNIGRRLQMLAKAFFWVGVLASFIVAVTIWLNNNDLRPTFLSGFLYLILGSLGSWIGSWTLYGLGIVVEYIENGGRLSNRN